MTTTHLNIPAHDEVARRLEAIDQQHLLRFYPDLPPDRQQHLLSAISSLDLERIPELVERYVKNKPAFASPGNLKPAPFYPVNSPSKWDPDVYRAAGEDLLRAGAVALFTVAGGQGTRLGYDGPKGCYPGSAVTGKPLFRCLAEWILAAQERYSAVVPWYIMTSPANDAQTQAFFRDQNMFGLDPNHVMHFEQGVMPSFDRNTGKILLAAPDQPAINPDGHGGSLRALHQTGALEDMQRRGIKHISYVQIDNPLVKAIDPVFIGLHATAPDSSAQMSSKMIRKTEPAERVGVFCLANNRTTVVEYTDLPEELSEKRDTEGHLLFNAGSPAIHILSVDFVRSLNSDDAGLALPFHRAEKKVPHIDLDSGNPVSPQEANAIKLETFVFDALPFADRSIVLETERVEEFAPIKNATGADSPESSRKLQTERAANWFSKIGINAPRNAEGAPDCTLEISPIAAMTPADLDTPETHAKIEKGLKPGAQLAI